MTRGRAIGIDYGTKRVGLAKSDPLGMFAQPVGAFTPDEAIEQLRGMHAEHPVGVVVIGWPLTEDGAEGEATQRVDRYVRRIRNAIRGVRVVRWDERFTSEAAREQLAGRGRVERGRVDVAAAGIILQEYLDQQGDGGGNPDDRVR